MGKAYNRRMQSSRLFGFVLLSLTLNGRSCWAWNPTTAASTEHDEMPIISDAEGIVGGVAKLPCDLSPPSLSDQVTLVIWYKGREIVTASPIYSMDARGRPSLSQARHWADERALGGRGVMQLPSGLPSPLPSIDPDTVTGLVPAITANLALQPAQENDAGLYRCRVDFRRSPTRNSLVNLTIVVPPRRLTLLAQDGASIQQHVVGPYIEGGNLNVACVAAGGRPAPRVSWWGPGDILLDASDQQVGERRVSNTLQLRGLTRLHHGLTYTCRASNSRLNRPLTADITIDMHLAPLWARILGSNLPLSAGNSYQMACQSSGSRPGASIGWWLGNELLSSTRQTTSTDGNVTTSTLTLIPRREDGGKILMCRASNPHLPAKPVEARWQLEVHYVPDALVKLGAPLNSSHVVEGADVYLECQVQANPWVHRISWKFEGTLLFSNTSAGTLVSNQTLVLQHVNRQRAGRYSCVASNPEGEAESVPLRLEVHFPPQCSANQQRVYGLARFESANVSCELEASPAASQVRWVFNGSAEGSWRELESGVVRTATQNALVRSILEYAPAAENDFGSLLCWGRNVLGTQRVPCVFHIVPAGRPDPPRHCAVTELAANSLQVSCTPGFDGGLPQHFGLEVFSASRTVALASDRRPEFRVSGLEPGSLYRLAVFAANAKGRSEPSLLQAETLGAVQGAESKAHQGGTSHTQNTALWSIVAVGVAAALLVIVVLIIVVIVWRKISKSRSREQGTEGESTASEACSMTEKAASASKLLLSSPHVQLPPEDDTNPDVIPLKPDTPGTGEWPASWRPATIVAPHMATHMSSLVGPPHVVACPQPIIASAELTCSVASLQRSTPPPRYCLEEEVKVLASSPSTANRPSGPKESAV